MTLPFSHAEFLAVFEAYNLGLWPYTATLWVLAVAAFGVALIGRRGQRLVTAILAIQWAWSGIAYHLVHFSTINAAAIIFGVFFLLQALLLCQAAWHSTLQYAWRPTTRSLCGAVIAAYGLAYPAMAAWLVGGFPRMPTFGVPCPTTLFTTGLLLMATPLRASLFIIPLIWAVIGGSAALLFDMTPDFALIVVGIIAFLFLVISRSRTREEADHARTV
ncbi:MAG TPA: DUF6064 family protein [Woeseiaceae bacterium]|nr:DUF6064 family protein [Woeseiaceae bacterium]